MRTRLEKDIIGHGEYFDDAARLHFGANSISLFLIMFISVVIAFNLDYLNGSYLKGLDTELSFFIGLFSVLFGISFYHYWRLGEKSVYYLSVSTTPYTPKDTIILFNYKGYAVGVGYQANVDILELPGLVRKLICVGILFNVALVTLDNSGFEKLRTLPSEFAPSTSDFCPEEDDSADSEIIPEGCELIIRAHKLGYAKDLGVCEPKKIDPEKMQVCQKRRSDEPYLHYMSRLLVNSVEEQQAFFDNNKLKTIKDKFRLQLSNLDTLRDYQTYAISAAPRASHHVWTDLPYPDHYIIQKYREYLDPNYCIERFQKKQTNTITLETGDERNNSKLLEHVYGQLLFNPKSKLTVGLCKEYKIHWNSEPDICERLASNPKSVLQQARVLPEVERVLHRHDTANALLSLEESIRDIENVNEKSEEKKQDAPDNVAGLASGETNLISKGQIDVKSKIAKGKQQIRKKNELVSFQCFMTANTMTANTPTQKSNVSNFKFRDTEFTVTTRYFPLLENNGESQISMYNQFSKVLEDRFHYSQLTSRSDVIIEGVSSEAADNEKFLQAPSYLFTRLDILRNVDIFLGNNWVLERDDLLVVYPYHVHLQNYVNKFREKYQERHGRL